MPGKSSYGYVKKSRHLKKKTHSPTLSSNNDNHKDDHQVHEGSRIFESSSSSEGAASEDSVQVVGLNNSDVQNTHSHECSSSVQFDNGPRYDDSDGDSVDDHDSDGDSGGELISGSDSSEKTVNALENVLPPPSLKDKLKTWALKNIGTLSSIALSELLCILKTEGHNELPRTANALLGTNTNFNIQPMISSRGNAGSYIYLGIENGLRTRVSPTMYKEDQISILVNIDGLPLYRNSKQQFWPILIKIFSTEYICHPLVVAVYFGDSQPNSVDLFLNDFIEESIALIESGLIIADKLYSFNIAAFVYDTPARSFIKCCKSHTGFYACERCEIKGMTVQNRRVFPEMNCVRRTNRSFRDKRQQEHHIPNYCDSPLLRIPNFDPVRSVVLDMMHGIIGVAKSLIEKWITGNNTSRISREKRLVLKVLLNGLAPFIPKEFQRKKFDSDDLANWKATQYRFFLLYAGFLILRYVLPQDKYRHFLLLFTAARILCSKQLAVHYTNYANKLLRKFFFLMPTFYGRECQVMNFHNLIHLASDVRHMKAPLIECSVFPFENCLGFLKRLIRTPNKPLVQVVKRLSELESGRDRAIRPHALISICEMKKNFDVITSTGRADGGYYLRRILVKGIIVSNIPPDNILQLKGGEFVETVNIYARNNRNIRENDVQLEGRVMKRLGNVFTYPCDSSFLGMELVDQSQEVNIFSTTDIITKCVKLQVKNKTCVATLLHL